MRPARSGSLPYRLIPSIVGGTFVLGLLVSWWLRARHPEEYARLGRTVLDDVRER